MIEWIDNGVLYGWYYVTDEYEFYGDGTKAEAERLFKKWQHK